MDPVCLCGECSNEDLYKPTMVQMFQASWMGKELSKLSAVEYEGMISTIKAGTLPRSL